MPTLQLSIDTHLQRATENAIVSGMADARTAGYNPTGGSAVAIDPWTGAIKAIASYPTFNQKLAATTSELPRAPLPRHDRHPGPQPRDLGRVSDRLDVQADHRRGRALAAGIITPYTSAALLRLVRPRRPHVLQRRARGVREHGSPDGARGVVRHVVLPARRPDLGRRSGARRPRSSSTGRACSGSGRGRRSTSPARLPAISPTRTATSSGSPGRRTTRARRSTSRSARALSRSARSSSPWRTRRSSTAAPSSARTSPKP